MIAFKDGWEPSSHLQLSQAMAKDFEKVVMSMFKHSPSVSNASPTSSLQVLHIAEYLDYVMYSQNHKSMTFTVTKDSSGNLIFTVNNKEK